MSGIKDYNRAKNCFLREKVDIENKEQLLNFLTEFTFKNGRAFTARSFGVAASIETKSLYPNDLVVVGNGVTTINGKEYLEKLQEEREKLLERNRASHSSFTVSISSDLRKVLWEMRRSVCDKYHMSIPMNVALQEFIREWGEQNERN